MPSLGVLMSKKDFLLPDNLRDLSHIYFILLRKKCLLPFALSFQVSKNQLIIWWNNEQKIHDFAQLVIFLRRLDARIIMTHNV